jgi:hypothetical protein
MLGIVTRDEKSNTIQIPAGSLLFLKTTDLTNPHRLVEADWDGKTVQIFAIDLRERCLPLEVE